MYIHVRVVAGAKKELFEQVSKDHFDATVREEAERNLANRRVVALVAGHFGVPVGKVRIVHGHHSTAKLLSVDTA